MKPNISDVTYLLSFVGKNEGEIPNIAGPKRKLIKLTKIICIDGGKVPKFAFEFRPAFNFCPPCRDIARFHSAMTSVHRFDLAFNGLALRLEIRFLFLLSFDFSPSSIALPPFFPFFFFLFLSLLPYLPLSCLFLSFFLSFITKYSYSTFTPSCSLLNKPIPPIGVSAKPCLVIRVRISANRVIAIRAQGHRESRKKR